MYNNCPRILVNHVGFRPEAGKYAVVDVRGAENFNVEKMQQLRSAPVLSGRLMPCGNDLGKYLVADLTGLHQPGVYRICVTGRYPFTRKDGTLGIWSHDFRVDSHIWDDPIRKLVNYYRLQSCGASRHGYNSPCHLGKIRRDDGGEAKPILGGWHSAHDGDRIVHQTMHGLFGLIALFHARPDLRETLDLLSEIRWGNDYFLALQSPEGFLYDGIAVVTESFRDPVKYSWWDSNSYLLRTKPTSLYLQYNFVVIQAQLAQIYRDCDKKYATQCLEAGKRCFEYFCKKWDPKKLNCYDLGTGVSAGVHLFRATGDEQYRLFARKAANQLLSLQAPEGYWQEKKRSPFLATDPAVIIDDHEPLVARTVYAPLSVLGLVDAARWLKDDADRPRWVAALERFAESYVKHFSEANAFGIMPYRAFAENPRQTSRRWKRVHYRYFMETNYCLGLNFCWQTGGNALLAGHGISMLHLAEVLDAPWLGKLAQRQLDWVLGVNPFDASMITGVGRNQPPVYPGREMEPPVPDIEGAVLQGPIGDEKDNAILLPGYYPISEYWMPHQAWVLGLMAELSVLH